jgi:hypothetical protein
MKPETFTIMPETAGNVLCIKLHGKIIASEFSGYFMPAVIDIIERHKEFRLLVYYYDFQGWTLEAIGEELEAIARYGRYLKKFALVRPPESEIKNHKFKHALFGREVRSFEEADFEQALEWVKS